MVELGFIFWVKRLKLMAFEMVSRINRRTTALPRGFFKSFAYHVENPKSKSYHACTQVLKN